MLTTVRPGPAEFLGMSLAEDPDLLWIAREGLKAPLPKDWKPCQTPEGEIYYFNFGSGDSTWEQLRATVVFVCAGCNFPCLTRDTPP